MTSIPSIGPEFAFIDGLRGRLAREHRANAALTIPPGDDSAELPVPSGRVLLAADMLLDGVHFDLRAIDAALAGRKALAVNLSDVAAMAGRPTAALVSLALPRAAGMALAERVMDGLIELAARHGVAIAGGDTNAWNGPFAINVAITGEPHARGSVTRAGARPGDQVLVTGALGGSIFGRHLAFAPRIAEAALLHERYGLSAMIDVSDGLGSDLRHVMAASGCAARLTRAAIPVHADAARHADGLAPLAHALSDGEDFELCFTLPAAAAERLLRERPLGDAVAITRIGEVIAAGAGTAQLAWENGEELVARGYVHQL
jgi:thiamine-monophosphate kinase